MAPRTYWKGYLKLSLVTCPVAMTPATTDSDKIRFRILNAKTHNPVESQYVDEITGAPVDEDDQVKGYPRGEKDHVILEDDEIDAVGLESSRTIDIETFVDRHEIDWVWFDRPHYLAPNDKVGAEAFSVIREAMAQSDVVGISRLVLYRRERAVLLQPRGKGIVLWTLRYGDEVRDESEYFDAIDKQSLDSKLQKMMRTLISEHTTEWDTGMVSDPVQQRLADIIDAKKKKRKKPRASKGETATAEKSGNVINIMDALRNSIKAGKGK